MIKGRIAHKNLESKADCIKMFFSTKSSFKGYVDAHKNLSTVNG
jgi:hypothetical protein